MSEKQVPLMQQPGYVYRAHKHIRAHRVLPGDIILDKRHGREEEQWTVQEAFERIMTGLIYATFPNGRKHCIGRRGERIWVARAE